MGELIYTFNNTRGWAADYTNPLPSKMGNIASRLPWKRVSQEDIDLWRVYQLIYYRDKCGGGEEGKIKGLKRWVSTDTQKRKVNDDLVTQVNSKQMIIFSHPKLINNLNALLIKIEELFEGKGIYPKFKVRSNPRMDQNTTSIPGLCACI